MNKNDASERKNNLTSVTLHLPSEQVKQLDRRAQEQFTSRTAIARQILARSLSVQAGAIVPE
jgi:predicted transcriptional regulator